MCDVVHAYLLDRVERAALVERQAAYTVIAAGAKGVDPPTVEEARGRFHALLHEEPKVIDADQLALRRALGVA